ncbi:major facilitator superfamily MFS_1 [Chloroherpeton thalassium ATCC 35110]|uniref:Major facilitator superfamily MFS_1 n=1 Tax=Chloroherpeton thalassium (strain ATCC 35110 / GB-78) TaxID=517418 RepID=B3QY61_CHLT3|nr:tetracycline resistance MFS efflux pump [Chloroherpeton thalassium]ACF15027.1 major facilitator superfamily MFS_1 [Chloroherpeton thalassium ATCC 35110]
MKKSPLVVLFFTVFIDLVGFGIVLPLLPTYAKDIGATPLEIGLIAASFSVMQFFFSPIWGSKSDQIGRRPIILISVAASAISYLIFSQSDTVALLLISRVLAGIGSANISATQAYITDVTDSANRSKAMGMIGAAFGLGFVLGPPLGGFLKTFYGISMVGYVATALTLLDLILAFIFLPESIKEKKPKTKIQLFSFDKMLDAFKRPAVSRIMITNFLFLFAFVNMQVSAALLWKEYFSVTDQSIGYLFAFVGVVSVIVQGFLIGKLTKKYGERKVFLLGNIIMALGLIFIPYIPTDSLFSLGLIFLAMLAIGNGLAVPVSTSLISLYTPHHEQGEILGISQSVGSFARILGPFSGSLLYGVEIHAPYLVGGALVLVGSLVASTLFQYEVEITPSSVSS